MKGYMIIVVLLFSSNIFVLSLNELRKTPHCDTNRTGEVLVHLFSWRWKDVAAECENFLGPKGFCGVQVSPPNEHRVVTNPYRPWWERYQPVSYKLGSASGNRAEFKDMVTRCNAAGVRVYADAVINHMAAKDAGSGVGSDGSQYDAGRKSFSGVPYGPNDFGRKCRSGSGNIENFNDPNEVRDCALLGLLDLDGSSSYVRQKIVDYLNDMLDIGIDGYRIDAAKHIWPGDLDAVLKVTKQTKSGDTPFVFQNVLSYSANEAVTSSEYTDVGRVSEFLYGKKVAETFLARRLSLSTLSNIKSWMMLSNEDALVFVDTPDTQRDNVGGDSTITYKQSREYKMATAFMLSWPYGVPRIMSSYDFKQDWAGPPSASPYQNGLCENGWICEHRWRQITNMVEWRNQAGRTKVENWWSNGNNQIAYSRGNAAFIAFNNKDGIMSASLTTGLPAGQYCDIISGDLLNGQCTGKTITVGANSKAQIDIDGSSQDPIIAFHLGSQVLNGSAPSISFFGNATARITSTQPTNLSTPAANMERTIVFIRKISGYGEKIFIRGGYGKDIPIPITYNYINPQTEESKRWYQSYKTWSQGDTELSWDGAENGQGQLNGEKALGSPMIWTNSNIGSKEYVPENTYGDHYWMWDVSMDCSKLPGGYFEFKGFSSKDGFERNVRQEKCLGETTSYGKYPINHLAKCGHKTVVEWGNGNFCIMQKI